MVIHRHSNIVKCHSNGVNMIIKYNMSLIYNPLHVCEISSSHGSEYEAQNLMGCTAVFLIECRLTSEMSVDIQLRTWQYIPEDSELSLHV
jgi:hypothetical protein